MLLNYIKIAFRNIAKHKLFTAINLSGLAMSMSLGLLIVAVISDLHSYDNFHVNRDNIYRIITRAQSDGGYDDTKATCPFPVANELQNNYEGYDNIVRIQRFFNAKAKANNKEIQLEGYHTESSFLKMFSFPLLTGNMHTALDRPNSIVISQNAAKKLFGETEALGRIISMGKFGDYLVTGVINDPPVNSHLKFDILGSLSSLKLLEKNDSLEAGLDSWDELFRNYVYLQKSHNLSVGRVNTNLQEIARNSKPVKNELKLSFQLQSINDIIPGPDLSSQIGPKMSYLPLIILSAAVFLILLSSSINYTNLSLARALTRAKEIGIRKAVGGTKGQLFAQFLTETFIISLLSLLVAYLIFQIIKPEFLKVVPRASEMFSLNINFILVLLFIGFAIFTALLAGIFPAFVLCRFNVIQSLKNDTSIRTLGRINLRKALIVFQFALSLIFIVGIVVVYRQYQFSRTYDHGFLVKNKMVVPLDGIEYSVFSTEFEKNPGVKSVTGTSAMVGSFQVNTTWLMLPDRIDSLSADYLYVNQNFIENLGISMLAGSSFSGTNKSREHTVIINKQMLQAIGVRHASDALGKVIRIEGEQMEIIGVVDDFNYAHLEEPIRNFIFIFDPNEIKYGYLSLNSPFNDKIRTSLESSWKKISSGSIFPGKSMELFMNETYFFYNNFIKIFGFVAFLAIAIGCLGLAGMSLYAARSRIKEIAIRKVMGATVTNILLLTSKGFLWLLFLASVIALPLSYLLFNQVLQNSAYHIQIGIVELGFGLLVLFVTGGITVFSQTWKAAISNPSNSLRTE